MNTFQVASNEARFQMKELSEEGSRGGGGRCKGPEAAAFSGILGLVRSLQKHEPRGLYLEMRWERSFRSQLSAGKDLK